MTNSATNVRAALYLRLSRDDDLAGDSSSILTQRQMLQRYAKDNNFSVVDEYVDDGYSGTNFNRPSFQRMISDIDDGKVNCVIVKDACGIIGLNQKDPENRGFQGLVLLFDLKRTRPLPCRKEVWGSFFLLKIRSCQLTKKDSFISWT